MPESKLISYITSDFQTKSDLKIGEMEWENIMNAKFDNLKRLVLLDRLLLKYGIKKVI